MQVKPGFNHIGRGLNACCSAFLPSPGPTFHLGPCFGILVFSQQLAFRADLGTQSGYSSWGPYSCLELFRCFVPSLTYPGCGAQAGALTRPCSVQLTYCLTVFHQLWPLLLLILAPHPPRILLLLSCHLLAPHIFIGLSLCF